jgi:hypothetical protein
MMEGERHKSTSAGTMFWITAVTLGVLHADEIRHTTRMPARVMRETNLLMNPSTARILRRVRWKTLSVSAGVFFGNPQGQ